MLHLSATILMLVLRIQLVLHALGKPCTFALAREPPYLAAEEVVPLVQFEVEILK